MKSLKLYLLNAQDLFLFMDYYNGENLETLSEAKWQLLSTSFKNNKELLKIYQIAASIKEQDPDIISLVEVGGKESLDNFNHFFLDNKYRVFYSPSNSDRGIDMGYLCKKSTSFSFKIYSHNKNPLSNSKLFSRGLLELRLINQKKVSFIFLLAHLKSKLDLNKQDFEGRSQREAEVKEILRIHNCLSKKFPEPPIIIHGDLNGIIYKNETEEELKLFEQRGIFDILEFKDAPPSQRCTYYYFNQQKNINEMQLDYVLTDKKNKSFLDLKESKVLKFDEDLYIYPPKDIASRYKYPSDHLAYLAVFKINY